MCHGACALRGRRRRRTLDASARLCSRAGAAKKSASAPGGAHALPDVHTDRARSGAAQAAQGPRTGPVGRHGSRYRYGAPGAGSKYPTHAAISACATRHGSGHGTRHDHGGSGLTPFDLRHAVGARSSPGQFSADFYRLLTGLQSYSRAPQSSTPATGNPCCKPLEQQCRQGESENHHGCATTSRLNLFMTACHRCSIMSLLTCRTFCRTPY